MRKWMVLGGVGLAILLALAACSAPPASSGTKKEQQQQKQSTDSLVNNQPLPHFNYSQIRQNLIEIETAQANGVQTTSFFFNQGVQDPVQSCPSIGVPIPNTMSLSNPQQIVDNGGTDSYYAAGVVGQMDPDGVYAPQGSSGTYVMCVNAQGQTYADYWEGFVQTVFGAAKWDPASHTVQLLGPPSFTFSKSKG